MKIQTVRKETRDTKNGPAVFVLVTFDNAEMWAYRATWLDPELLQGAFNAGVEFNGVTDFESFIMEQEELDWDEIEEAEAAREDMDAYRDGKRLNGLLRTAATNPDDADKAEIARLKKSCERPDWMKFFDGIHSGYKEEELSQHSKKVK